MLRQLRKDLQSISAVVNGEDASRALYASHQAFFNTFYSIELYIVGIGSVGTELIEQIKNQTEELKQEGIVLKVCAIANSKTYIHHPDGIDLNTWRSSFNSSSHQMSFKNIMAHVNQDKPLNGILVDCTSSDDIASQYS